MLLFFSTVGNCISVTSMLTLKCQKTSSYTRFYGVCVLASFPSLIIDWCRVLSFKEAGVRSLDGRADGVWPEGSILFRLPRNNMRAGETALWVKELVAQGWPSEFNSWN